MINASIGGVRAQVMEIDTVAVIRDVVDGDTLDAFPAGRIRFADIDAPEWFEEGYTQATNVLENIVNTYGPYIYLDVDNEHVIELGDQKRLIAVVYVRVNATHVMNVNQKMVDEVTTTNTNISDYDNEFNPTLWSLYVEYPGDILPPRLHAELLSDYIQLETDNSELVVLHDNLQTLYDLRVTEYNVLFSQFIALNTTYHDVLLEHDLNQSYVELLIEYNQLNVTYQQMDDQLNDLASNYTILESQYQTAQSDLSTLEVTHDQLNVTYLNLQDEYAVLLVENEQIASQLGIFQLMSIAFGAFSIILVAMLVLRKS
jgi:hypothetical protein